MNTVKTTLERIFIQAFQKLNLGTEIMLTEATKPEFGDFQVNGIMKAAKILKLNPRDLANQVIAMVKLENVASLEIAGAGFINIKLEDAYLAKYISSLNSKNKFGVSYLNHTSDRVVVDMSSPNLAKEMHVGHLRSTVIGDALARMFEYMGDSVIRQNHVGDWGTQFGMLIAYLDEMLLTDQSHANPEIFKHKLSDLEKFYREAKALFDADSEFADKARQFVVILQNHKMIKDGNYSFSGFENLSDKIKEQCKTANLAQKVFAYWQSFRQISLEHCQTIYAELNVPLNQSNSCARGESWYNDRLLPVIDKLTKAGIVSESAGAKCIFFTADELSGCEETPFIIQKKDGGFLYATTDLAAIDYRAHEIEFSAANNALCADAIQLGANRLIYVVDKRQALHFQQLFLVAKKSGLVKDTLKLEHTAFGTMMNENGQPFKTRSGEVVKLGDLINEAKVRAKNIVDSRNPSWNDNEKKELAEILAISAIKYSDLSKNRTSDYIFSFDKMLAFEGNTAPYLLYAYTRIQSLLKKANDANITIATAISLGGNIEHKLGLHLAKFADTLSTANAECYPHYITQYLYNLAVLFMQFYEACPILKIEDVKKQQSRLALANLTAQVLKTGFEELLGITVVNRM